jgi:hypothetical protein
MPDDVISPPEKIGSRKARIGRRVFIGSALLGGAGWWLTGAVQKARNAARRSADK